MKRLMLSFALACAVGTVLTVAQQPVRVDIKDTQGQSVGTASLSSIAGGGVAIALDLRNLAPGVHALHIHQVAKCEPPFATAGPHFNPDGKQHGMENPAGPHAGDMNNVTVADDGTAKVVLTNSRITLGEGPNSVFANGGTAIVIHEKADDMKTDPAGAAGARIACGVIKK